MRPESEAERAAFIDENSCNISFHPWCAQGHLLGTGVWPLLYDTGTFALMLRRRKTRLRKAGHLQT